MLLLIGGTLAYLFLPWPWWLVVVVILAGAEVFEVSLWLSLRGRRPLSGHEALVGEHGLLAGPARVRIRGTSYPARVEGAEVGDRVEVVAVEGMTLVVRQARED
ncbi:MAG TPA: NfeD family protein [Actinomycetota bacterium]|nr:NfeD family protein [Actinomycetota bacterium]